MLKLLNDRYPNNATKSMPTVQAYKTARLTLVGARKPSHTEETTVEVANMCKTNCFDQFLGQLCISDFL